MKIKFLNGENVECTSFNEQSVMKDGAIYKWIATFVLKNVSTQKVSEMVKDGLLTTHFDVHNDDGALIASVDKYETITSAFLRYRDEGVFTEIQLSAQIMKEVE